MIDAGTLRSHTIEMAASRSASETSIEFNINDILNCVKEQSPKYLPDSSRKKMSRERRPFSVARVIESDAGASKGASRLCCRPRRGEKPAAEIVNGGRLRV